MSNRKHDHKLVVEHEYERDEQGLSPILTPRSLKAESPVPDKHAVAEKRPRKVPRLDPNCASAEQLASAFDDADDSSTSERPVSKGSRKAQSRKSTHLADRAVATGGKGSLQRGRETAPVKKLTALLQGSPMTGKLTCTR